MVNPDFLGRLMASLDPQARREFGEIEQCMLVRSMDACGMTQYPPLAGPAEGERTSGDMICETCGLEYGGHPLDWRVIGYGNVPFLKVLCDGRRVKL